MPQIIICKPTQRNRSGDAPPPQRIVCPRSKGQATRLITYGLSFILSFTICFGLTVATVAGIAYGYNYSMAEFITFTRSDVTVFMRRGQFHDKLDSKHRRSGAEDLFSANISTDYEDQRPPEESKPLADTWLKTQDTRKYAERLTRYNPNKKVEVQESETQGPGALRQLTSQGTPKEFYLKPTTTAQKITTVPNPVMPTVTWRSGTSQIMMRNFEPLQDFSHLQTGKPDTLFPTRSTKTQSISSLSPNKQKDYGDERIHDYDKYVPMRVWGTKTRNIIVDEPEDVDEDNIVYKPV